MGAGVARATSGSPRKIRGAVAVAGWAPGGHGMPHFVPLLRYLTCSLIGREVIVKRDLQRGKRVNSVGQAIDVIDKHPGGVRHGLGPRR